MRGRLILTSRNDLVAEIQRHDDMLYEIYQMHTLVFGPVRVHSDQIQWHWDQIERLEAELEKVE